MSTSRRDFLKYAVGGVAAAGAVAVGSSAYYKYEYLPSQAPTAFGLGHATSLGTYVILLAAQQQNYFAKNKLAPTFYKFAGPSDLISAFAANQFPFAWDPSTQVIASLRAQGVNVQEIYPAAAATSAIMVKADSPYHSIYDLKGKPVGVPSLPSIDFLISAEVWNQNHPNNLIDPLNDFKYTPGAVNIVSHNLLSGGLEAAALFEPFVSVNLTQGARILADSSNKWNPIRVTRSSLRCYRHSKPTPRRTPPRPRS